MDNNGQQPIWISRDIIFQQVKEFKEVPDQAVFFTRMIIPTVSSMEDESK